MGALYVLLNVRSPTPPVFALLGLLGIRRLGRLEGKGLMWGPSAPVAAAPPHRSPGSSGQALCQRRSRGRDGGKKGQIMRGPSKPRCPRRICPAFEVH
nr:DUF1427 family protein [Sphingomonas sp. BK481]